LSAHRDIATSATLRILPGQNPEFVKKGRDRDQGEDTGLALEGMGGGSKRRRPGMSGSGPVAAMGIAQVAENAAQAGALAVVGGISIPAGAEREGRRVLAPPRSGARGAMTAIEGDARDRESFADALRDGLERR
jgi:hypothetical protein